MSGLLLDTNVVIDDLPVPTEQDVAVSVLTCIELASGINAVARDPEEVARRRHKFEAVLAAFDPLPVSTRVLDAYRDVDAAVRRHGRNPRPRRVDLVIAATAVAHDLELLTANVGDFAGLEGLLVVRRP